MSPGEALERGLDQLALELPKGGREKLLAYVQLLAKWNRIYNLTAIRTPLEMVTHHVLDSLAVVAHLPIGESASLADVGSGAGLPGIPLAIARPAWRVTVNDSIAKKAAFLRQAKIELGLPNVGVHEGRAERWKPEPGFQLAISRAFADLRAFISTCRHLVASGGWLAAMKGAAPGEQPGCRVIRLEVPLLAAKRHLVLCQVR
jgi:16S rRNA (guanine527-N7)-methyltransferase